MPRKIIAALLIPLLLALAPALAHAQTADGQVAGAQAANAPAQKRIALVVGNAGYQAGALNTPANDAGLIAQTLEAAGFDVVGARDLDQDSLRRAFRDFLDKASSAGPDTVAFIYLAGYGIQLEGENYFVPVDAKIAHDTDVAAEALRLSDYTRPLSALKLKATIVVLDAARANPFAQSGQPLAGGLALVDPDPGMLIAFNAAPGTVAPEAQGPYGPYAQALAEMMREGGLPLADVFDRVRLRVNDLTKGAQVPWQASKVEASLVFFERAPDAPPPAVAPEQMAEARAKPIRAFPAQEAYSAALERDTIEGYNDFVAAYPDDAMTGRVRAIIAARREAITWRRSRLADTPAAYWSYLQRYPEGPHAPDAHRRLAFLSAALEPPPSFEVMAYDVPPPPPDEIVYVNRPVLMFDDPVFAFAPPPPPPVLFLAPPPPDFVVLDPPPPPVDLYVLPCPVYRPVPVWVRPPVYVAPPPANNVIYTNIHNTVVINNVTRSITVTNPGGQTRTFTPTMRAPSAQVAPARGPRGRVLPAARTVAPAGGFGLGPSLPPSVAQKAALQTNAQPGAGAPGRPGQFGKPLSGMKGQPTLPAGRVTSTTPPGTPTPGRPTPGAPVSGVPTGAPTQAKPAFGATAPNGRSLRHGTIPRFGSATPGPAAGSPGPGAPTAGSSALGSPTSGKPRFGAAAPEAAGRGTAVPLHGAAPKGGSPAARLTPERASGSPTATPDTSSPAFHANRGTPPAHRSVARPTGPTPPAAPRSFAPTAALPPNARSAPPAPPRPAPAPAIVNRPAPPPAQRSAAPPSFASRPATPPPVIARPPAPPRPAPPPQQAFRPAAAAPPRPAAPPPQPARGGGGGCPPGKSMAMVGGHPTCR